MKIAYVTLAVWLGLSCGGAFAKSKDADLKTYLAGVTERGRALYSYDQAAWHGTDAFLALHPDTAGLGKYVCKRTESGWVVYFGKLNDAKDKYLVLYEATETGHTGKYDAHKLDTPREENGGLLNTVTGLELAFKDFGVPSRSYNSAVLPGPDGEMYIYLYPAQVTNDIWPIGGDARYLVSADGTKILEKRQLHKTVLDREFKTENGNTPEAGFHTHVLSNVPEETDVLNVLSRTPSIPEYVGTMDHRVFAINTDGTIVLTKP